MILQGDQFFNIQLAKSFENSLIFNSLNFYWHVEVTSRIVMILQGDTFFNIYLFKPPMVCFVHINGGDMIQCGQVICKFFNI